MLSLEAVKSITLRIGRVMIDKTMQKIILFVKKQCFKGQGGSGEFRVTYRAVTSLICRGGITYSLFNALS